MLNHDNFDYHKATLRGSMKDKMQYLNMVFYYLCSIFPMLIKKRDLVHIFGLYDFDHTVRLTERQLDLPRDMELMLCNLKANNFISTMRNSLASPYEQELWWTSIPSSMDIYEAYMRSIEGEENEYEIDHTVIYVDFQNYNTPQSLMLNRIMRLLVEYYPAACTRKDIYSILRNKSNILGSTKFVPLDILETGGYLVSDKNKSIYTYKATTKTTSILDGSYSFFTSNECVKKHIPKS